MKSIRGAVLCEVLDLFSHDLAGPFLFFSFNKWYCSQFSHDDFKTALPAKRALVHFLALFSVRPSALC